MTRADALSLHELSYLCGGPKRAVLTAVLALCQSDQVEIGTDGRVYSLDQASRAGAHLQSGAAGVTNRDPAWPVDLDPVEQSVLDVLVTAKAPARSGVDLTVLAADGTDLAAIFTAVAESAGMHQTRGMLVARGLAPKWLPGLTRLGRRARREVLASPPDGLRRIAVLGPNAVQDALLRQTLTQALGQALGQTPNQALTATPTPSPTARQAVRHTPVRRGAASSA